MPLVQDRLSASWRFNPDPTCRAPARIVDRWTLGSTDGPVEHVKTGCERGHWFTPTVESLHLQPATAAARPALVP